MYRTTFFLQQCPTCGRHLQVRTVYLGKTVACRHCRAQFQARDPASGHFAQQNDGPPAPSASEELLTLPRNLNMQT